MVSTRFGLVLIVFSCCLCCVSFISRSGVRYACYNCGTYNLCQKCGLLFITVCVVFRLLMLCRVVGSKCDRSQPRACVLQAEKSCQTDCRGVFFYCFPGFVLVRSRILFALLGRTGSCAHHAIILSKHAHGILGFQLCTFVGSASCSLTDL